MRWRLSGEAAEIIRAFEGYECRSLWHSRNFLHEDMGMWQL